MAAVNVPDMARLIRQMLDRSYEQQSLAVMRAIAAASTDGIMATRLKQLDAEADRLAKAGQKLTADNPVLRAALADMETVMAANTQRLNNNAAVMQNLGVTAAERIAPTITLMGMPASVQEAWNQPDPDALRAAVDYSSKPAWKGELEKYKNAVPEVAQNVAIRGIAMGRGPLAIARDFRKVVEDLPVSKANNIARTLQLASYRNATAQHYVDNSRILTGQARIAVLDKRTCMTCVTLHGTVLPVGAVVEDHHQGRCTSIGMVRGFERQITPGVDWFAQQDEDTQIEMMGETAYEYWKQGRIQLQDFIQPYQDDVYGRMLRQASLSEIMGRVA